MTLGPGVVNCLLVVLQGPKGELSWTFVPEVTLKEVCTREQDKQGICYHSVTATGASQAAAHAPHLQQQWQQCQQQQQATLQLRVAWDSLTA